MTSVKKQVTLCAVGTLLEWYDFSLFVCLTPILSQIFFQKSNAINGMLATFTIFGSGFIMRPLGALFFGHLGDLLGRKYSLLITIFTMTIATTAIGLIPTNWGYATIFLVICRLVQGFASSGEYPGALTLLSEQHTLKRKAFIASTGVAATGFGSFFGALTYVLLLACLDNESMKNWGWRIPFLLGAPLGIASYFLRKHIFESAQFNDLKEKNLTARLPLLEVLQKHLKPLAAVMSISILMNTLIYINFVYFGNYGLTIHKLDAQQVIYLTLMFTFIFSISMLLFGFIADYMNKKILLLCGYLLVLSSAYPLFKMILIGNVLQQFIGQGLMAFLFGIVLGPYASILPEQFPTRVRYSGLSITLNFAASFFGGSAPILCGWISQKFEAPLAPLFYILFLGIISTYGIRFLFKSSLHPDHPKINKQGELDGVQII